MAFKALLHQHRPDFIFKKHPVSRRNRFCTPHGCRAAKSQAKGELPVQYVGAEIHLFRPIRLREHGADVKALKGLGEQFLDHAAVDVGQTAFYTVVIEGEFFVIDA